MLFFALIFLILNDTIWPASRLKTNNDRHQCIGGSLMKITRAEVEKVARLSRLSFSEQELVALTDDMDAILAHVEQLNELDTDDIVPMAHAVPLENAFREDSVTVSLGSELALENAPQAVDGCFGVPKVIE